MSPAFTVRSWLGAGWIGLFWLGLFLAMSEDGRAADDRIDYLKQIRPILRGRCIACHGALKQKGGLRLDTAALAIQGGDSGPAIEPGNVDGSLLLARVSAADVSERMPPEGDAL